MLNPTLLRICPKGTHGIIKDANDNDLCDAWSHLTVRERVIGRRLEGRRKTLYVLSRCAAKQALNEYSTQLYGCSILPTEIDIYPTTNQGPTFKVLNSSMFPLPFAQAFDLSLTHSGDVAVALVGHRQTFSAVGIDVEKVRTFKPETVAGFLTAQEMYRYECLTDKTNQQVFLTTHWCLKEAYLKARKVGLRVHPRRIAVTSTDQNHFAISEDGKQSSAAVHCMQREGGYIIATVGLTI